MIEKPFKTYDEQIQLLVSRGIVISNSEQKSFAKKVLQHEGYYNLINGYSKLFLDAPEHYKSGTALPELFALYTFDKKLREIFFRYILHLETNVKSLIAYYFPQKHRESNYLVFTNFDVSKRHSNENISNLFAEIQRQIAAHASDPSISHYLTKYGYIPIWVLNNILTIGTISKFYSLMMQDERQSISKTFHIIDKELESSLFYISSVRNFCAHGNRLYCYRSKRPLCSLKLHELMNIPIVNDEYAYGKRDLFAALIILKLTLSKSEFRKLVKEIDIAIKNLKTRISVITEIDVLESMGFPNNWKELVLKF